MFVVYSATMDLYPFSWGGRERMDWEIYLLFESASQSLGDWQDLIIDGDFKLLYNCKFVLIKEIFSMVYYCVNILYYEVRYAILTFISLLRYFVIK